MQVCGMCSYRLRTTVTRVRKQEHKLYIIAFKYFNVRFANVLESEPEVGNPAVIINAPNS